MNISLETVLPIEPVFLKGSSYSLSSYSSLTSSFANKHASEVSVYTSSTKGKYKIVSFNTPIFHSNYSSKANAGKHLEWLVGYYWTRPGGEGALPSREAVDHINDPHWWIMYILSVLHLLCGDTLQKSLRSTSWVSFCMLCLPVPENTVLCFVLEVQQTLKSSNCLKKEREKKFRWKYEGVDLEITRYVK